MGTLTVTNAGTPEVAANDTKTTHSLRRFGVLPNSGLDETARIANAIASVDANSVIQFEAGTYMFTLVNTRSNIHLKGAGYLPA